MKKKTTKKSRTSKSTSSGGLFHFSARQKSLLITTILLLIAASIFITIKLDFLISQLKAAWSFSGYPLLLLFSWILISATFFKYNYRHGLLGNLRKSLILGLIIFSLLYFPKIISFFSPSTDLLLSEIGNLLTGNTIGQLLGRLISLTLFIIIFSLPYRSLNFSKILLRTIYRFFKMLARFTINQIKYLPTLIESISNKLFKQTDTIVEQELPESSDEQELPESSDEQKNNSNKTTYFHSENPNIETTPVIIKPSPRTPDEIIASANPFDGVPKPPWTLPSLNLLKSQKERITDEATHKKTAASIESTLAEYGVEGNVTEIRPGPTVTLYGIRPGWTRKYKEIRSKSESGQTITTKEEIGKVRVKVDKIAALDKDLALQLKAPSIRIDAPIPGTNLVGIEVPNKIADTVYLQTQLLSKKFSQIVKTDELPFSLGKGSGGDVQTADITKMPHLLVAGATGSGKSVFVNSLITGLLTYKTPQDLRFIMIDPKRVELTVYNGIPHLITPVIVDPLEAVNALRWLLEQMDERLKLLSDVSARDIKSYNEKIDSSKKLPYLMLIVDELADLMMTSGKSIEQGLVRLAQMGRATGIHLVVATQRPSVDVVTGIIKANFPARISFNVTSLVDSRTILDSAGAEKLLGKGDMLYLPQDMSKPVRIQGSFLSEGEAQKIVLHWSQQSRGYVPPSLPAFNDIADNPVTERNSWNTSSPSANTPSGEIMQKARELAETHKGKISTSLLQRRLGIGYPRAARLKDQLIEEGLASEHIPNAPAETRGLGSRRSPGPG